MKRKNRKHAKIQLEKHRGSIGLRIKGRVKVERFRDGIGICFG